MARVGPLAGLTIGFVTLTLITITKCLPQLHVPCAANYGDEVHLECTESGFNASQGHGFIWMKNGGTIYTQKGEIVDAGNCSHEIIEDGVRLVIHEAGFSDAGVYSCSLRQRVSLEKVLHVEAKAVRNKTTCLPDNYGYIIITLSKIYPPNPVFGYVSCIQSVQAPKTSKLKHVAGTSLVRSSYSDIPEFSDLIWTSDMPLEEEGNYTCTIHVATICLQTFNVTCSITEITTHGFWWSWKGIVTIVVITVATIGFCLCLASKDDSVDTLHRNGKHLYATNKKEHI